MHQPRIQSCNLEEYQTQRESIITPERIGVDSLYSLVVLQRRPYNPKEPGLIIPAKVKEVTRETGIYIVAFMIETEEKHSKLYKQLVDSEGEIEARMTDFKEGCFTHRTDHIDDELQAMIAQTDVPLAAATQERQLVTV